MGPEDRAATGQGVAPGFAIEHARSLLASAPALAEQQAREVLKVLPDDARALAILGVARRRQGDLATARQVLQLVASRRPEVERAGLELALTLAALGEGQDAIETLRGMARRAGPPIDWLAMADAFALAGEPAATVARAEHLRRLVRGPDALAGVDSLRGGRPRDAALMLEGHLRRAPDDAPALWAMAEAQVAMGRGEEAAHLTARCIALAPDLPGARAAHARMLLAAGKPDEALRTVESCVPDEQAQDVMQFLVASCRLRMGDHGAAGALAAALVAKHPDHARLWVLHAMALAGLGREAEARAALARAASLRADKGEPWWRMPADRTEPV